MKVLNIIRFIILFPVKIFVSLIFIFLMSFQILLEGEEDLDDNQWKDMLISTWKEL